MSKVRLIGLWADGPVDEGWPDVKAFVDPTAAQADRHAIADRLDAGVRAGYAYMGYSSCRFCGQLNGSGELTDGTFLWPEGLGHYVRDHHVRLPAEIEEHLRSSVQPYTASAGVGGTEAGRDTDWWRSITSAR